MKYMYNFLCVYLADKIASKNEFNKFIGSYYETHKQNWYSEACLTRCAHAHKQTCMHDM